MAVLDPVSRNYGRLKNYVNGEWVDSGSSKVLDVRNPATTEVIAQVPLSTKEETKAAIDIAHEAWWSWRETAPGDRTRCFFKLKTIMEREYETIARIISQEQGKTIDDARGETRRCIDNIDVAAGITSLQMGYNLEDGAASNIDEEVIVSPLGVFAAVCPFNFPGMVPFWFWPYAVATGNMFFVKPSEQVPITTQYMFKLIDQAGFPPGV
ncbi:MAG: aldehyde dehydrogenase family protein, partial [Thermoplasmata archaeon]